MSMVEHLFPFLVRFPVKALANAATSDSINVRVYIIKGDRMQTALQTVERKRYAISLYCLLSTGNCDQTDLLPSRKLVLVSHCQLCEHLPHTWRLREKKLSNWVDSTDPKLKLNLGGKHKTVATIKRHSFTKHASSAKDYCIRLTGKCPLCHICIQSWAVRDVGQAMGVRKS